MAAELEAELDAQSELVASHGGVFEVFVGKKKVFSKSSSGRFPEEGEVVRLIRSRAG